MCWRCDNPGATDEDYLDELRDIIRAHGWAVQAVEHDRRPYAYSIGLHDHGMPELLVTGLSPPDAAALINWSAAHLVRGLGISAGQQFTDPSGRLLEVVDVDHPDAHMTFAVALGGPDITAQQLVWADRNGRWPWDARWSHGRRRQPVLGIRRAAA
jgi:hypothetical protein